jgi:hypothetical protein
MNAFVAASYCNTCGRRAGLVVVSVVMLVLSLYRKPCNARNFMKSIAASIGSPFSVKGTSGIIKSDNLSSTFVTYAEGSGPAGWPGPLPSPLHSYRSLCHRRIVFAPLAHHLVSQVMNNHVVAASRSVRPWNTSKVFQIIKKSR